MSSAMRMRRLKSAIAPTMASRFVLALVNLIASSSSRSGISTVVFTCQLKLMLESYNINFIFLRSALLLQWTACLKRNLVPSRNPTDLGSQQDHQALPARGRSILFLDPHREA